LVPNDPILFARLDSPQLQQPVSKLYPVHTLTPQPSPPLRKSVSIEEPIEFERETIDSSHIYMKGGILYFYDRQFKTDDKVFIFDNGTKFSVRLLNIGKDYLTVQRTDGSKTHLSLGLLLQGKIRISPR
jgi:hypothetical protein